MGEPGRCVVVARRQGDGWWIGGINGTDRPRALELELPVAGEWRLIADGADRHAFDVRQVPADHTALRLDLAPRGGFLARSAPAGG